MIENTPNSKGYLKLDLVQQFWMIAEHEVAKGVMASKIPAVVVE
jgi:hypothetical protein